MSLLLTSSAYFIPVLIATGATDIPQSDWKAGTFAVAGTKIGGKWLGSWIVVSTAISVVSSFCAELAAGKTILVKEILSRDSLSYGLPLLFQLQTRCN